MIVTAIREAETEQEVYFFLTAYVETLHYGDQLNLLPESIKTLPLTGLENVQDRFQQFMVELDRASKRLDHKACGVIKEALHAFGTALVRLEVLNSRQGAPSPSLLRLRRKTDLPYLPPELVGRLDGYDKGRDARAE